MAKTRSQRIGQWGETAAARYLEGRGFQIIARNVRTPYGEIDLIACLAESLVFVEVKTRTSLSYGYPEVSVTPRKLEHMIAAAQSYVEDHPELAGQTWQIDVIAVQRQPEPNTPGNQRYHVEFEHFENITA